MGAGAQPDPAIFLVPTQILSFPNSLQSQASAQPCAHLRHTQTLRRVPKVTHLTPGLGALGCLLWVLPPTATPGASLLPPATPFPVLHPEHTPHPGALKYFWATCMPSSRPLSWLRAKPCQTIGLGVVGSGQRGCLTRAVRDTPLPSWVPSPSLSPLRRALCSSCFCSRRPLPILSSPPPPHSPR